MASLDDTLARLAPKTVEGLQVEWNLDSAGAWIEVAGWFSPGTRFGEPKYQVPFKKTVAKTGDTVYDISIGVADVLDQVWRRLLKPVKVEVAAEPAKRRGRPIGSKNKPKLKPKRGSLAR
jgi:hypothetical protein